MSGGRTMLAVLLSAALVAPPSLEAQSIDADAPAVAVKSDSGTAPAEISGAQPSSTIRITPTGNVLWTIPFASLTATRERPIFSASRRPPAVALPVFTPAVQAPTKVSEPVRPPLVLIGTVIGEKEGFGVFVDETTKSVVRLRAGDDYHGWILNKVRGREAMLQKDDQTATLSMPRAEEVSRGISHSPK